MSQTVYIVTGANRGIGFHIVDQLAKSSSNLIFATARNPAEAKDLNDVATKSGNVHVVKLSADSAEDNKALARVVKDKAGKVDVVIANAGISGQGGPIATVDPKAFETLFATNTFGPLHLFQATHELISKGGIFAVTSSGLGSVGHQYPDFPTAAYGTSKAAANYIVARIRAENPHILTAAIHPGLVSTDMAKEVVDKMDAGTKEAYGVITPAESGTLYIQNLEKIKAEKPEKAVFLFPGGKTEEW